MLGLTIQFKFGDETVVIPHVETITRVMVPGGPAMKVEADHPEHGVFRLSLISDIQLLVIDPREEARIET